MDMHFQFYRTPDIIFGQGVLKQLPELISRYGKAALVVTGAASFQASGFWERLNQSCSEIGIKLFHEACAMEPSARMVDDIRDMYQSQGVAAVVGIGGGSVIDGAKAVSAMLGKTDSVIEYLEGVGHKTPDGSKIPFIAVPTTSGTGSEATKNAVISEVGPKGFKKSLRHDNFVPDLALVDPRLMLTCPAGVTAACGMDAFTQLLEAYLSPKSGPLLDALLLDGLEKIHRYFMRSISDGSDMEPRSAMAYAALVSGIGLANSGLGVVHGFASPIGGFFKIPHGVVCGTLMAPATGVNVRKAISGGPVWATEKYARVGRLFSEVGGKPDEFYCHQLVEKLEAWTRELSIPHLSDFGITENDLPKIIDQTGLKNNPVALNRKDLREILLTRIK
jgi:alcohol dehydrogenase